MKGLRSLFIRTHWNPPVRGALILGMALVLWSFTFSILAAGAESDFDAANKLYEQGRYPEAAAAYEKLAESGPGAVAPYFNLGNALYKSGEVGRAIAAYRKAERLAPRDPDVRANLQFIRNQIQGPTFPAGRAGQWLGRLTVNEWTLLASIAFWVWLLLLASMQLRPAWRTALRTPALLGGLATTALVICLSLVLSANSARTAIVITGDAVVRNGPLEESQTAFTVHDGAELSVLDEKNEWLQVSAGNRSGWLKREQVVIVPQA